jgi:hypothetical protein
MVARLGAKNNPDGERGTTFTFSLPLVTRIQDILFQQPAHILSSTFRK